ncbi:transporter substrate-binding domain-containing protein [uncultured Zoogloea sp.]|uniref:transporter substrate-binding domain-containing protein n=1 Tax=uncultured Zoogloea sp. TaxID=160237 RepID=UPI00260202E8|nr:transporter substrate-binding domain-containing protein [uncultured Zoogloea sp.]
MSHTPTSRLRRLILAASLLCLCGGALADDLREVRERGVLRHLGVPYANFVTGSGDGLDVEIVQLFARHLGVRYEFVPSTWENVIGDLTGKEIRFKPTLQEVGRRPIRGDMIANGMTILPPRLKVIDFSDPTFPSAVWLLARPDTPAQPIKPSGDKEQDIRATKTALRLGTTFVMDNSCLDPTLYDLENKGLKLKRFTGSTNLNDIVPAMLKHESDMTLLDVPDVMIALELWPGKIKVIGPISEEQRMAAAFRKDSPELREAFNSFLAGIKKDGTYMKLVKKYFRVAPRYLPEFFNDIPGGKAGK